MIKLDDKTYVIGPNFRSFQNFLKDEGLSPGDNSKYIYVWSTDRLRGLRRPNILLLNGWTHSQALRGSISEFLEVIVPLDH